jgi:hypothetical protein
MRQGGRQGLLPRRVGQGGVGDGIVQAAHPQGLEQDLQVGLAVGEEAQGVQAVRGLEHAGARQQAEGRLVAVDAAEAGRAHDGGPGLGAHGRRNHAHGHGHGRAAGRGARGAGVVVGVAGLAQGVHRELGGDGLARDERPGVAQPGHGAGVVAGLEVLPQGASHLGGEVHGVDHVLDAPGHAFQEAGRPAGTQARLAGPSLRQQPLRVEDLPGQDPGLPPLHPADAALGHLHGAQLARGEARHHLGDAQAESPGRGAARRIGPGPGGRLQVGRGLRGAQSLHELLHERQDALGVGMLAPEDREVGVLQVGHAQAAHGLEELLLAHARALQVVVQGLGPHGVGPADHLEAFLPGHEPAAHVDVGLVGGPGIAALEVAGEVVHAGHDALRALVALEGALDLGLAQP